MLIQSLMIILVKEKKLFFYGGHILIFYGLNFVTWNLCNMKFKFTQNMFENMICCDLMA